MTDRILLYPQTSKTFFVVPVVVVQPYVFTQFSQPIPVTNNLRVFEQPTTVTTPVVQTFIFSSFSQPQTIRMAAKAMETQTQLQFVGGLGPAQTPPWFVFSDFGLAPKVRANQSDIQFSVLPLAASTLTPSSLVFLPFDLPQVKRPIQDQWVQFTVQQEPPFVLTPVFTGFTDFGIPIQRKIQQADASVTILPQVVVVQPYVFSPFEQPRFNRALQQDWSNIQQPLVVAVVQPYIFSKFEQPSRASFQAFPQSVQFSVTPPVVVVQPYIFSPFEQPQFKKQIYDPQPGSTYSVAYQPYVFSAFNQPGRVNYQYFPQSVQYSLRPFVVVTAPNFTGFSDFGLPQQLIGTQRRQDGSSVDFRVLQPPFVASPLVFYGWYDFGLRPSQLHFKVYEQPQVIFRLTPPPPSLADAFAGKRWKYQETKKTHEVKKKEPKVIPLESSNLVDMAYDEEAKQLKIQFKTYKYENVGPKKAKGLQNADSHGKYFHKNIKNKHPTTLIRTK